MVPPDCPLVRLQRDELDSSPWYGFVVSESARLVLLHRVSDQFGLLTTQREHLWPDECEIGQIRITTDQTYVLRWLDPDARWESDDRPFRYEDVTRIDFDGEYERTLMMVAEDRDRDAP